MNPHTCSLMSILASVAREHAIAPHKNEATNQQLILVFLCFCVFVLFVCVCVHVLEPALKKTKTKQKAERRFNGTTTKTI